MRFTTILLALILVFGIGNLTGFLLSRDSGGTAIADPIAQAGTGSETESTGTTGVASQLPGLTAAGLSPDEERNISVFRTSSPSVAFISSIGLRRDFFSLNVFEIPQGTGSGFVWDDKGHIVTNYHVIQNGDRFKVALGDEDFDAVRVGVAPRKDLAVLRIEAPRQRLRPIPLGRSANLMVGQRVLAIGNPFGLDQSLTIGIVSALGRELDSPVGFPIRDVIQTDAAINPGNSGGPLLDSAGRLIGVNTAIYSPSGASAGIGFAVPVDTIRELVPQIIEHGKPVQPGIGIELVEDRLAARVGVRGIIVRHVVRGGPADRAGIQGLQQSRRGLSLGDVIVAVDGNAVTSLKDLVLAFEDIGVGGVARLTLERSRSQRTVEVTLVAID